MIFYFSATGNCKYVAERIAEATQEKCVSITESMKKGELTYSIDEKEVIGIISPTYALGIPSIVMDFLKAVTFKTSVSPYLFFVATYGTTPAHSGFYANQTLKKKTGMTFEAFYSIKMPDTWTPMFDLSNKEEVAKINKEVEPQLDKVINQINERTHGDYMKDKLPHFTAPIYKPYYRYMSKTNHFSVEDTCIGCSLCAKKCPVNAIEMKQGKPTWIKDHCVMCLGCLHRCPKFAIQYGKNTKSHGQYRNPNTSV